jgi:hypothetical protein
MQAAGSSESRPIACLDMQFVPQRIHTVFLLRRRAGNYVCCCEGVSKLTGTVQSGCCCEGVSKVTGTVHSGCCCEGVSKLTGTVQSGCCCEGVSKLTGTVQSGCCCDGVSKLTGTMQSGCCLLVFGALGSAQPCEWGGLSWSLLPRHGTSSGCGWRNGLRWGW